MWGADLIWKEPVRNTTEWQIGGLGSTNKNLNQCNRRPRLKRRMESRSWTDSTIGVHIGMGRRESYHGWRSAGLNAEIGRWGAQVKHPTTVPSSRNTIHLHHLTVLLLVWVVVQPSFVAIGS